MFGMEKVNLSEMDEAAVEKWLAEQVVLRLNLRREAFTFQFSHFFQKLKRLDYS